MRHVEKRASECLNRGADDRISDPSGLYPFYKSSLNHPDTVMNSTMKSLLFAAIASSAAVSPVLAEGISNGDFESWTNATTPDSWERNALAATQVTGLDGSGYAAQLGSPAFGAAYMQQTFTHVFGAFSMQVDFQLLASGDVTPSVTPSRTFNVGLRQDGTTIINLRLNEDAATGNPLGSVEMYDGSGWQSVEDAGGTQSEYVTDPTSGSSDVYRLTISGVINDASSSYDVELWNVTDGTLAASATNITYFQGLSDHINQVQFVRGRSEGDYIVDNVSVTAIPEPGVYALLAGALSLGLVMIRRRRGDA